ncbi:MAG: iron-containing alcohol dehydrogenase [Candidatus Sericytochromatia bacterium]
MRIDIPDLLRLKADLLPKTGKYLRALEMRQVVLIFGEGLADLYGPLLRDSLTEQGVTLAEELTIRSADSEALFHLSQRLPAGVDGLFALGGGLAIDAAKYLSHLNQLPLLVCPGAVSNDGFASPFSSLLVNGQKRTLKTRMPRGILLDPELLAQAPPALFYAGVGDLVSNLTAIADWKLAFHRRGTYVDDFAVSMAQMAVEGFLHLPDKSPEASLRALAQGLMMSGIAMAIAGSSRPASGSEHLISHALDHGAQRPLAHGLQVGLASYWVSLVSQTHSQVIAQTLEAAGVLDGLRAQRPLRSDWQAALKRAPSMKSDFYTVLDEPGAESRLLEALETDPLLRSVLV